MEKSVALWLLLLLLQAPFAPAQEGAIAPVETKQAAATTERYLLGVGDEITVRVLDLDEIPERSIKVDAQGEIRLPLIGALRAEGLTVRDLEARIAGKVEKYLKNPSVTVTLVEGREQPMTVLGSVNAPGIRQIRRSRDLLSIISESGGFKQDAGPVVRVTRPVESGPIPLASSHLDETGRYSVADVEISSLLGGKSPGENIAILPHDLVAVPPAALVYVLGEVSRPGGYEITTAKTMSVLNAVAHAGGTSRNASASRARVLRPAPGNRSERTEFVVNLNQMLAGKTKDFQLEPNDILYLPTNKGKVVTNRAIEAMVGTGSSIAVFRGSR